MYNPPPKKQAVLYFLLPALFCQSSAFFPFRLPVFFLHSLFDRPLVSFPSRAPQLLAGGGCPLDAALLTELYNVTAIMGASHVTLVLHLRGVGENGCTT